MAINRWVILIMVMVKPFFSFGLSAPVDSETAAFAEVELVTGESRIMDFGAGADLHANRRGVIDLEWLSGASWRVTALKSGVVLIKGVSSDKVEIIRMVVKVVPPQPTKTQSQRLNEEQFPALCGQEKGVRCMESGNRILGESDSWNWYFKAAHQCRRLKQCHFEVRLSSKAQADLIRDLSLVIPVPVAIEVLSTGQPLLILPCTYLDQKDTKSKLDGVLAGAITQQVISLSCERAAKPQDYQLRAKVFFIKDIDMEELGVNWQDLTKLESAKLRSFLEQNKSRILSDPVLRVRGFQDFEIRIGGERQIISQGDKPNEHWRPTGMIFSGRITPRTLGVSLDYDLRLSIPSHSDLGAMHASGLKSSVEIELGEDIMLGEVTSSMEQDGMQGVPVLSQIPIIWPLFTFDYSSHGQSKVYLSAKIEAVP